jgi:hypothetical protein
MGRRCSFLFAWLLGCSLAGAELPVARLDTVSPPGCKAGDHAEVVITGDSLDEADNLRFSHPGITAVLKSEKHFNVTVAPDTPTGIYDVRVSGALGVSNPRAFVVGDFPESAAAAPHDKPESAIELPMGTTFNGVATAAAADYFKFNAAQGQRVLIECLAQEIDSQLSPVIAVFDSTGNELAASRRGFLDFTAPATGAFVLRLHDLTFAGGPERFYRLTFSASPHLDYLLPPAAAPGAKGKFTLFGRNLPNGSPANLSAVDGRPLEELEVEIEAPAVADLRADGLANPAAAAIDGFSYRLRTPQGDSNPVFISYASVPLVQGQAPKHPRDQPQQVTPPCEIAGQFYRASAIDAYAFPAKKGDIYWIEVASQRLGLPTNPFFVVQREGKDVQEVYGSDANIGSPRFSTVTRDPSWRLESKDDGLYRVSLTDLFGATRCDPAIYRLTIRRESPDFCLVALAEPAPSKADDRSASPSAPLLRRGGTIAIKVVAFRRDNFAGDIELSAEGLPPGVTCIPTKILAGKNDGLVFLTAGEFAEKYAGALRILGRAQIGGSVVQREARGGTVVWRNPDFNNDPVTARLTRDFEFAVSAAESAPISIEPSEDKVWEAALGAKLEIPLKITRRGEFKDPLELRAAGAPGIEAFPHLAADPKAETLVATLDPAALHLPAGAHTIYFSALTKGKFRKADVTTTVYSTPIRLSIKEAVGK